MSDCVLTCPSDWGCEILVDGVSTGSVGMFSASGMGPFNASCMCGNETLVYHGVEQFCDVNRWTWMVPTVVFCVVVLVVIGILSGVGKENIKRNDKNA